MNLSRRAFLGTAAGGALAAATGRKPNVVLIVADDLGYGDLGCYGQQQLRTPHIDRLATEGLRFTQAYAGSTVCAPSRCCLMTGVHTGHARIRGNKKLSLLPGDLTVAELFQRQGYKTGLFGKWGLAGAGDPGTPDRKGFNEWFGYLDQVHAHNYYPDHLWDNGRELLLPGNWGNQKQAYTPDLMVERTLSFIDRHKQEPFFLFCAYTLPHANNEAVKYAKHGMEVPDQGEFASKDWPDVERSFAAMVGRLDAAVGQIQARLAQHGLTENTLVIFTSDNGPHREGGHDPRFFRSSGPLRGIKRDLYEGGIRVPFVARWPGHVPVGQTSDQMVTFWDFLPTAAELTGATAPRGLDGRSMLPALEGKRLDRPQPLYWEFHEGGFAQAIRNGKWKAVRKAGKTELFDLEKDLGEQEDLALREPAVVDQMTGLFRSMRTEDPSFPVQTGVGSERSAARSPRRP